jgi:hypothetical protein
MITEIFAENKKLDITKDISSLLTFSIDDVKNFAERSTTFSKTVVLPGTANNNAIFGNIFEIGIANDYDPLVANIGYNFNPAVSARCIIFQDNLQTFRGTLRLIEIVKDKRIIEYEVALNGELTSLNVALSSGFLTDLDFSAYNEIWNEVNVAASWDRAPGSGVYYPLIDYGTYSQNKHDWNIRAFRPALYVKEYIDKIFTDAQFTYDCDLFETDRFKRLVIPHNQKQLVKLTNDILSATSTSQQHIIDRDDGGGQDRVFFGNIVGGLFTTTDGKTLEYVGTDPIATTLTIHLEGFYNFDAFIPPSTTEYFVEIFIRKNITTIYTDPTTLNLNGGGDVQFQRNYSLPITLIQGDTFEVQFRLQGGPAGPADVYLNVASLALATNNVVSTPVDYNELIDLSFAIPKNIRQVDFIVSIVKLWNLYVYEDQFDERLIHIKPFINFYSSSTANSIDWTYKLNRDTPIKIKPLSEINSKFYEFNYKPDSDFYNEQYAKRYNQGYGSHIYDTQFEFASQSNRLELIFAPTPLVGYENEDKVYSTIFKRTGDVLGQGEEKIDSVIRILQTKKIIGVSPYVVHNGEPLLPLATFTAYGYAGHYNDPNNPTDDINFGILKEVFYILRSGDLTNTQFENYWSAYMREITDKDSKMLIGRFYLTAADIFHLDFSKYIFLDGAIFRLNKIIDYNASQPSDCMVELLKVIDTSFLFIVATPVVDETFFWIDADNGYVLDSDNGKIPYQ